MMVRTLLVLLLVLAWLPAVQAEEFFAAPLLREDYPQTLHGAVDLINSGRPEAALPAIASAERALKRTRPSYHFYFLRGVCYRLLQKPAEARAALKQSVSLRGSDADAHYLLATIYFEQKDFKAALPEFRDAAWFGKGRLFTPDLPHLRMGQILAQNSDPVGAQREYRLALSLDAGCNAARVALAKLLIEQDRSEEAEKLLREALGRDPGFLPAKVELVYLLLALSSRTFDDTSIKEARRLAGEIIDPLKGMERYNSPVFGSYIKSLLATGDLKGAATEIDAALLVLPENEDLRNIKKQVDLEAKASAAASASPSKEEQQP